MKPALALFAALTLSGCSGIALSGFTVTYQDGDQSISGTAHFQRTGKEPVATK
jgi:hypothetical protein